MSEFCETILLATDGAPDAVLAARAASDLASRAGAELHVVHVWSLYPTAVYPEPLAYPAGYPEMLEESAAAILKAEEERIRGWGGTVARSHLRMGNIVDEIVSVGLEIDADLLVVGSRGHGRLGRLVLGSVAEGVVHEAASPVLVVRGSEETWPPLRVIVGDDGSEQAERIAEFALRIARLLGASALLVRAIPPLGPGAGLDVESRAQIVEGVEGLLAEHATRLEAATGVRPQVLAAMEDPASLLLDVAEARSEPALLVVGSRGLGRIARLRLGSVSTKLLHASRWPVLIGPPAPR